MVHFVFILSPITRYKTVVNKLLLIGDKITASRKTSKYMCIIYKLKNYKLQINTERLSSNPPSSLTLQSLLPPPFFLAVSLFRLLYFKPCYVNSPRFSHFPPFQNSHLPLFPLPLPYPSLPCSPGPRINYYPAESVIGFPDTYPLNSNSVIRWIAISNV